MRCARLRRRIRFLRHFQRMWPRFFQTRELRFIPKSFRGRPAYGLPFIALADAAAAVVR